MDLPAYIARPAHGADSAPGVVVAFEMFGLTDYVRRVTDRIAALGYLAIAPDFYHRFGDGIELTATPEGREQGLALLRKLDRPGVVEDFQAAVDVLDAPRVAAFGMSVGGHLAYYAATQLPFDALAAFYPGWLTSSDLPLGRPEPTVTLSATLPRTLLLTGENDHLLDAAQRTEIGRALTAAGVDHELVVYPDTPHGFFCDERESYRADAAADSWRRVGELFRATLGD